MSEKALKNAIYFLAVVTALYLLTTLLTGGGGSAAAADGSALTDALAVDRSEASSVEIEGPDASIRLEQADGGWTVNGFPADSTAVDRFWRGVEGARVASVAATNPANHERLGITEDSAWRVTFDGGPTVLLGNTGSQFGTAYARLPGDDVVHLIRGDLRSAATRALVDWRDKLVLALDTASVARVEVTRDGATRVFERGDSVWTEGGDDVEATTIRNLLQELAAFQATGFAPDSVQLGEPPDRSVVAFDDGGNELGRLSMDEGEGNLQAASSQSPYVFQVPSWRADRVAPAAEESSPGG